MEFKDYYAVLGVKPETPVDEIKRSYRKLARQYHPDVSKEPDAENRFKEINEAWEVLQDKEKRSRYDAIRAGGGRQQAGFSGNNSQQYQQGFSPEQEAQFSDFFQSIFGDLGNFENTRSGFQRKGQDYHVKMEIPLSVAYHGGIESVQLQVPTPGSHQTKNLQVKIPPGVMTGSQIRLKGQGGASVKGPAGDIYIEIEISPHPYFSLHQKDIHLSLPITPWEAALGATIPVPTLGGQVNLKIQPNSQSGKKMRLKGRGMPGSPPGDQFVILQIHVPQAQTDKDKAFYQEMARVMPLNPRTRLGV
ncbi:MAG: DnaJ domain-containing protein [Proteobacteria bacterium]|nr:DnaJ domain-containing protein [Pseudomonadota bacterium]